MTIYFWSDPHLGLNRTSHTTPASRKALREALFDQAIWATSIPFASHDINICLGDLFDTTENDEATIAHGATVASRCNLVLSGNHDLSNRDGRLSSLQLIGELVESSTVALADKDISHFCLSKPEAILVAIPHKRTQQLFEETLRECVKERVDGRPNVLLLHCNYNSGFDLDDATLNLSRQVAEDLLQFFDYILIGHEHISRSDFDGRLQILGNIHPTSFSDISDKYVWSLVDGRLEYQRVWETATKYRVIPWEYLLQSDQSYEGLQFIEVVGTCPAARLPEVSKAVQKLWTQAPDAFMIRNKVISEALEIEEVDHQQKALDVPDKITAELAGTPLSNLWKHYLETAK